MKAKAVAVALAVVCACALGCSKKKAEPPPAPGPDPRPAPISAEERRTGIEACKTYVAKICACAAAHPDKPDVVEMCKYDESLPAALDLSLTTADHQESTRDDIVLSQSQARKIATQCMDQTSKMLSLGCGPL